MRTQPYLLAAALGAAGLLTGFAAKRLATGSTATQPHPSAAPSAKLRAPRDTKASTVNPAGRKTTMPGTGPHSTDTLETILALKSYDGAYGRLALWMLDASEQDIAAYWQHYRLQTNRSNDINDLIFINWTRLNPQGATAAAAGTPDEHYAWWAWACHDPQTALATAIASNPARLNNVAWGIGEFHGDWLREHFDQIPEDGRRMAIQGLVKWDDGVDPLETLQFLKENDAGFNTGIFKSLVRKDPWAAYDWIQQSGGSERGQYGRYDSMGTFVKAMSEAHPDLLERIAQQSPSGKLKREMEAALFENLLKTDPEAAIEQAKSTKPPRVAAERLSSAGLSLVSSDPDRAFDMAKTMFELAPNALNAPTTITYPGGGSNSWSGDGEALQFMNALLAKDPARVMTMVPPQSDNNGPTAFSQLAESWANRDLVGYSNWVNAQNNSEIREPAAGQVVNQLQNDGLYAEAADWALSLNASRASRLYNLLYNWNRSNPDEAREWLESVDLPEQELQRLEQIIKRP